MRFEASALVRFPRAEVWRVYRDELAALVPYMPNIASITVAERQDNVDGNAGKVRLKNIWKARSRIPAVATPFLKEDMLMWDDHAVWDDATWTCSWRTETHFFRDRTKGSGTTRFLEEGGATRLQLVGDFTLDLKGMSGVPRILAGTAERGVESFVISLLSPNTASVANSIEQYMRAKPRVSA